MVTQIIDVSASQEHFFPQKTAPAWGLGPQERKTFSLQVLSQTEPVSRLAQKNGVSRKFLYQQAAKASDAIDEAFSPSTGDEEKVLFYSLLFACDETLDSPIRFVPDPDLSQQLPRRHRTA